MIIKHLEMNDIFGSGEIYQYGSAEPYPHPENTVQSYIIIWIATISYMDHHYGNWDSYVISHCSRMNVYVKIYMYQDATYALDLLYIHINHG